MNNEIRDQARVFLQQIPSYLIIFWHNDFISEISQQCLDDLGYRRDEVCGKKKFTELLTSGSRIFFDTHFFPLVRLHGRFTEIYLSLKGSRGEDIPALLNVSMQEQNGSALIYCSGLRISRRNQYEEEILQAKRTAEKALLKNQTLTRYRQELEENQHFLEQRLQEITQRKNEYRQVNTIVSHDLQEPLRKVGLFSTLLLQNEPGLSEKERTRYLLKIKNENSRIRNLLRSLQRFISLNQHTMKVLPVDLNVCVGEAQKRVPFDSGNGPVNLQIEDLPELTVDIALMTDLFAELLQNSVQFRDPEKPALNITIKADEVEKNIYVQLEHRYRYGHFLRIVYTDNGIGFGNEQAEEVFSLFRKAHHRKEGQGWGLAYCRKIVHLHKGEISASSEPGKGTAFTIMLPLHFDADKQVVDEAR